VSVIDPTQAPPGQHTAHMWAAVPWAPEDNSPAHWNDVKSEYASTCLEQFARYAPNIDETNIVETHVHTPIDARRAHPNMLTGHPEGAPGQQRVDQPDFRGPIDGLYLSGAPTHPGGNVCGAPGYNCAGIILDDRDIEKWWTPPVPGV